MEEQRILHWLKEPEAKLQFEKLMEKNWEYPSIPVTDTTDYVKLLEKIHQRVLTPTLSRKNRYGSIVLRSLKIAASLTLILFTGYYLSMSWFNKDESAAMTDNNPVNRIERTTGIGEKLTLSMPDGSRIIVNSESTIQFNSDYGHHERILSLSGEAYFEVAPDSLKPFSVEANGITTIALGTAFNISTKHSNYQVALTEGRVSVGTGKETVKLNPGQMAVWKPNQLENKITIKRFDPAKITAWKDGRLAFDRKQLLHILKDLETWYGVIIAIGPEVNSKLQVSGTFENKNLKDILTGLSFSSGFSFELNGNQVTIKK